MNWFQLGLSVCLSVCLSLFNTVTIECDIDYIFVCLKCNELMKQPEAAMVSSGGPVEIQTRIQVRGGGEEERRGGKKRKLGQSDVK